MSGDHSAPLTTELEAWVKVKPLSGQFSCVGGRNFIKNDQPAIDSSYKDPILDKWPQLPFNERTLHQGSGCHPAIADGYRADFGRWQL
jgi:hypothetical protein